MTDPLAPLNTEIAAVGTATTKVATDVNASIQSLKNETNLSLGALIVGGGLAGKAGTTVAFPIHLVPGSALPTALKADINLPAGIHFVFIWVAPVAKMANKE